jgi:hypothetical protein
VIADRLAEDAMKMKTAPVQQHAIKKRIPVSARALELTVAVMANAKKAVTAAAREADQVMKAEFTANARKDLSILLMTAFRPVLMKMKSLTAKIPTMMIPVTELNAAAKGLAML